MEVQTVDKEQLNGRDHENVILRINVRLSAIRRLGESVIGEGRGGLNSHGDALRALEEIQLLADDVHHEVEDLRTICDSARAPAAALSNEREAATMLAELSELDADLAQEVRVDILRRLDHAEALEMTIRVLSAIEAKSGRAAAIAAHRDLVAEWKAQGLPIPPGVEDLAPGPVDVHEWTSLACRLAELHEDLFLEIFNYVRSVVEALEASAGSPGATVAATEVEAVEA
jgi:hypothetical protein